MSKNPYRQEKTAAAAPAPAPAGVSFEKKTASKSAADEALFDRDTGEFNPPAYAGRKDTVRDVKASLDPKAPKAFDKKGQLNAYDNRDALTQIAHILGDVTKRNASNLRVASKAQMPDEDKRKVIAAALKDPSGEGMQIIGQEMLSPIKDILDYEGWIRKLFRKRKLGASELFRIPKDVRSTAWVVGQDGQSIESRLYGKWIQPGEFKITSFPTVDIEEIYQLNYDVLERAQDTARQEIELEEDKRGLALIDIASTTVNAETTFTALSIPTFEAIRYQVERHRLVVENFLINRAELSDLINVGVGSITTQGHVDPVTERELILAGYVGNVLSAKIITAAGTGVQEVVPAGTCYAVTGPEFLGEMGIRIELFSEPFNKLSHKETVKGWAFVEMVGFGLPNPRTVAKGTKA